ncbi:hypothetical protein ABW20_dc0102885 [Dactylellina cionopaga]|nr:hypothetical protein ABW20_dc0102885 [Dactylellina cionopaga]
MERYTDEKHPDVIYEIESLEFQQPKPKRPLWRRIARVLLTIGAVFTVLHLFKPVMHMRHKCHKHQHSHPPQDVIPPMDLDIYEGGHHGKFPVEHYTFPADLKTFYIKQESFPGISRINVIGNMIVHSCDKAQNISAHFKFELSDSELRSRLSIEPHKNGLVFKLNPLSLVKETVNATVFLVIPKSDEYNLEELTVSTISLPIWIKDTFTTKVDTLRVSTVSGPITAFGKSEDDKLMDVNSVRLKTVNGLIHGEFPLNHALDLETTSGDITADVVSANREEEAGYFKTSSVSGDHTLKFISKLNPRPLYSTHRSVSGDIKIDYPEDWQGDLKLKTTSGHIEVEGKGTDVIKKEKGPVGRFWKVIKGVGKSKGSVATVSGKIDILIGEKEDDE